MEGPFTYQLADICPHLTCHKICSSPFFYELQSLLNHNICCSILADILPSLISLMFLCRFSINSQTGEIFVARQLDYSKQRTHNFVVIAKDQGGESSKQTRCLVQIVVIETRKPTTRKLTTPLITTEIVQQTSTTILSNKISETKRRTDVELDQERTRSSSPTVQCFVTRPLLVATLILSLRALVT